LVELTTVHVHCDFQLGPPARLIYGGIMALFLTLLLFVYKSCVLFCTFSFLMYFLLVCRHLLQMWNGFYTIA